MPEYQIIVKIPFEALDDVEARQKARQALADPLLNMIPEKEVKFQRVHKNKPPEGLSVA